MNADEIYAKLATISRKLEERAVDIWCLERQRDELRTELRRINARTAQDGAGEAIANQANG